MEIKYLILKNFRNFNNREFSFNRINIIKGPNGKGKTNLLEAIYFLGNGYSHRLIKTEDIVKWGTPFFYIKGEVKRREGLIDIEISYKDKKIIKINGKKIQKKIELVSKLPMVIFYPSLVDFLFSSPYRRRYFLDREISKFSIHYYFNLVKYINLLKRRNIILKKFQEKGNMWNYLDTIDQEIIKVGIKIINKRREFIEKLNKCITIFAELFDFIDFSVKYNPSLKDIDEFKRRFFEERDSDMERGYTQKGPHRDDFSFILKKHDAKQFASQGERKLIVLFVIFSIWRLLKRDELYPLLLIDEFSAELDNEKIKILSELIERSNGQVFITSFEDIDYIKEKKIITL